MRVSVKLSASLVSVETRAIAGECPCARSFPHPLSHVHGTGLLLAPLGRPHGRLGLPCVLVFLMVSVFRFQFPGRGRVLECECLCVSERGGACMCMCVSVFCVYVYVDLTCRWHRSILPTMSVLLTPSVRLISMYLPRGKSERAHEIASARVYERASEHHVSAM